MGPRSTRTSAPPTPRAPRAGARRPPRFVAPPAGAGPADGADGDVGGDGASGALRPRHAQQAPAGDVAAAAHGHRAARRRACSRCWRSTSSEWRWRSSPRWCSRKWCWATSTRPRRYEETRHFLAVRLPADGAAVRALGAVRRARAAPGPLADRGGALPGRVRRADIRASSAANTSRASTSSTARWRSRCCTSPRCARPTSG